MSKTLLIVEDDASLLDLLTTEFSKHGVSPILTAKDGQEGLEIALAKQPDLILTDVMMPNMDGVEMVKAIRADERGKSIPIIMLTNLSDSDAKIEALSGHVLEYVIKSDTDVSDIIKKVKKVLGE